MIKKYGEFDKINESEYSKKYYNSIEGEMTQYPYRFKTKEEFISQYGNRWYSGGSRGVNWATGDGDIMNMDALFGKDLPLHENELLPQNKSGDGRVVEYRMSFPYTNEDWAISWWMITKNRFNIPNYTKKNIDRLRTLSESNGKKIHSRYILHKNKYGELDKINESEYSKKYYNSIEGEMTQYPYRFKTEEEFKSQYGDHWQEGQGSDFYNRINWAGFDGYSKNMDGLFGKDLPLHENELLPQGNPWSRVVSSRMSFPYTNGNWIITWWMITKNRFNIPNYTKKNIDRLGTLLESNGEKIPDIWCDNRDDCVKFEDFLHKNGFKYRGTDILYFIRDGRYPEVTFVDFDLHDKRFTAYASKWSGSVDYKSIEPRLKYLFMDKPNYIKEIPKRSLDDPWF